MEDSSAARQQGRDEALIDGGVVEALEELPFHEAKHRADTARRLAFWLVMILGGSVLAHYLAVVVLTVFGKDTAIQSLEKIFNGWLPVIASLVSAATTYYFTKER